VNDSVSVRSTRGARQLEDKVRIVIGSPAARALHEMYPAIDLHADTLMWSRWVGYDMLARHERPPLPRSAFGGHLDLPRMREGGMGAQFFGLVSLPVARAGLARVVDEQIDLLDALALAHPERIRKVRTAEELEQARANGAVGALLGIEGAHALEGDLDRLGHFARRGVRYLGILHFSANEAGYPAYGRGRRDTEGLTPWGKALVERCEHHEVLVDLAHINRAGFFEACRMARRPVIVSHTGVTGAHPHWRNIDDEQLRAVADTGGVIGIIFVPRYLGGPGLDAVVRHIAHVVRVAGEDAPSLGSDWDGMVVPTTGLHDAAQLPRLTDALLEAGFSERVIGKLLRENAMRVLREA
jgi:membrane dipeptidase